jgi:hypothetical protein
VPSAFLDLLFYLSSSKGKTLLKEELGNSWFLQHETEVGTNSLPHTNSVRGDNHVASSS